MQLLVTWIIEHPDAVSEEEVYTRVGPPAVHEYIHICSWTGFLLQDHLPLDQLP